MSQIHRCKRALWFVISILLVASTQPAARAAVASAQSESVTDISTTADFYVSPQGRDTWPGTLAQPFATIDHARVAVRTTKLKITNRPITVLLRGGTYYLPSTLTFTSADSGTASAPIVYASYPGEAAILSGGKVLGGWTVNSDGSWQTTITPNIYFTQLWRNGVRLPRTRTTPNSYLYITAPHVSPLNSLASDGLYYHSPVIGGVPATMANLSDVELIDFAFWDVARLRIASIDPTTLLITTTRSLMQDPFHGFLKGHRFLLENVKEALKQPGQWYLDRSTWKLTYLPKPGEVLSSSSFVAPRLQKIIYATGLSHVTFSGLTFAHNDFQVGAGGYASGQAANTTSAALSFHSSTSITFQGSSIQHIGAYAVEFMGASSSIVFRDGSVTDTGAGGIRIGTQANCAVTHPDTDATVPHNVSIINNLISGTGRVFPEAFNIMSGNAHHILVQNNEIADGYSTGVGVGFNWNYACNQAHDNIVQFNHIHDLGQGVTSDFGAVYFLSGVNTGNKILNNKVHDLVNDPGGYGAWGLYLDNGSLDVTVANNLVYRTTASSLHLNISDQPPPNPVPPPNQFLNNVLVFAGEGLLDRHNDSNALTMILKNNVIYYDREPVQFGYWNCRGNKLCTAYFQLDDNLYFDKSIPGGQAAKPFMSTPVTSPNSGRQPPFTLITTAQWKALGEDTHSFFADPLFKNPVRGIDDYTLQSNSPAFGLGFVAFDATQADRLPGYQGQFQMAPAAFPVQLKSAVY